MSTNIVNYFPKSIFRPPCTSALFLVHPNKIHHTDHTTDVTVVHRVGARQRQRGRKSKPQTSPSQSQRCAGRAARTSPSAAAASAGPRVADGGGGPSRPRREREQGVPRTGGVHGPRGISPAARARDERRAGTTREASPWCAAPADGRRAEVARAVAPRPCVFGRPRAPHIAREKQRARVVLPRLQAALESGTSAAVPLIWGPSCSHPGVPRACQPPGRLSKQPCSGRPKKKMYSTWC